MMNETLKALQHLSNLNETAREFETEVVKLATNPPHDNFIEDLEVYVNAQKDSLTEEENAFIAYSILVNYQRRMRNYHIEEQYIESWRHIFEDKHPFFGHMDLLSKMDNVEYFTKKELLELAVKNSKALTGNMGAKHAFCEVVASIYENDGFKPGVEDLPQEVIDGYVDQALQVIDRVIEDDPKYAKYLCTKGRLLTIKKQYSEAIQKFKDAIAKEDSSRTDYTMRVNQYQIYLQQTKSMMVLEQTESELNQKIQEFESIIEHQSKESLVKNMEYLGLFAGIISFTIGSIGIATSVAGQSLIAAAGLIIVLMGALLCVFSGFGFILHGINKKTIRNLIVFIMGVLIIWGGLHFCLI